MSLIEIEKYAIESGYDHIFELDTGVVACFK